MPESPLELLSLLWKSLRGFPCPCDFMQDDPGRLIWEDFQNFTANFPFQTNPARDAA